MNRLIRPSVICRPDASRLNTSRPETKASASRRVVQLKSRIISRLPPLRTRPAPCWTTVRPIGAGAATSAASPDRRPRSAAVRHGIRRGEVESTPDAVPKVADHLLVSLGQLTVYARHQLRAEVTRPQPQCLVCRTHVAFVRVGATKRDELFERAP